LVEGSLFLVSIHYIPSFSSSAPVLSLVLKSCCTPQASGGRRRGPLVAMLISSATTPEMGPPMPDATIVTRSPAANKAAVNASATLPTSLAPLPSDERLIPAAQMPGYIGLAVQTLARLRHEGKGPRFVRVGRLIYYRADDVRRWLDEHTHSNTIYDGRSQDGNGHHK